MSSDATSCVILIAVNPASRSAVATHLDSPEFSLPLLFRDFDLSPGSVIEIFLLGACPSAKNEGRNVLTKLVDELNTFRWGGARCEIRFALLGNRILDPESDTPRARDLGVVINTSDLSPHAVLPDVAFISSHLEPPLHSRRARFWGQSVSTENEYSEWEIGGLTHVRVSVGADGWRLRHCPWVRSVNASYLRFFAFCLQVRPQTSKQTCIPIFIPISSLSLVTQQTNCLLLPPSLSNTGPRRDRA